jgi:thioredoxin-related protein
MIKTVLPEKEIGDIFNTHFINAQVDIESEEGKELVRDFKIAGTPTLLFLTPDGKLMDKVSGFKSKEELIALSKRFLFNGKPVAE